MAKSEAFCMDCMEALRAMPDNAFDLAVVDPPYGSGLPDDAGGGYWERFGGWFDKYRPEGQPGVARQAEVPPRRASSGRTSDSRTGAGVTRTGGAQAAKFAKKIIAWDTAPGTEYFEQLFRVSRNQIIWGGNYFELPRTRCFLVWRKTNIPESFSMAMAEYAWTSFNRNAKVFDFSAAGQIGRFHPTQKPVELYRWIFQHYAEPGMKILDTHLGSGSSRIAAYDAGLDFTGYEIDREYFDKQEARFAEHTAQLSLFAD